MISVLLFIVVNLFLVNCQSTKTTFIEDKPASKHPINYTIIYYIHADSDYLYHTSDGNPVRNNSAVLETAISVAKGAKNGEVLIFIQRSEKKRLGLFPQNGSRFLGYQNGELFIDMNYRHTNSKEDFLFTEALLSTEFRSTYYHSDHKNYFLYYGHEVPTNGGKGYHQSLKQIEVTINTLSSGLNRFLPREAHNKFDLIALSTCNNGTAEMMSHLMMISHVVLASPQDLHLSHIQSSKMHLLEVEPGIAGLNLGQAIAEDTFDMLTSTVKTPVTLALYNLSKVKYHITSLLLHASEMSRTSIDAPNSDNIDCFESEELDISTYKYGVLTWYKSAKFGRNSSKTTHSGWGCRVNATIE